jgi:hypothetical protein
LDAARRKTFIRAEVVLVNGLLPLLRFHLIRTDKCTANLVDQHTCYPEEDDGG